MNTNIWTIVGLAFLPALGNFAGGLLAEWATPSDKVLNRALHAAAGVILAVVAVEVMPRALESGTSWVLALSFLAGGCAYLFMKQAIERWQDRKQDGAGASAWMVYLAVVADLLGDGLLIGAGSAVSIELALLLAFGQVLADVPEGYAVIANYRDKGVTRAKRLILSASFTVPVVVAAVFAFYLLRDAGDGLKMAALVGVAGLYVLAAVEDMLREAHEAADDSRWSAFSFIAGFAIFLVVSDGFG